MTDRLPDGLTDESVDVQTERSFPRFSCFRKFHTGILIGIFTMNLANGRMDGTDNGHFLTDRVPGAITFWLADRQVM